MSQPSDRPAQSRRQPTAEDRSAVIVRLAVGLAHSIPGAELTIRRPDGEELVAAIRPDADLNLCSLRRLVVGAVGRSTIDRWVEVAQAGGTVEATGDGLWSTAGDEPRRWFATLLRQEQVITILREIDTTDIGDDGIEVVLKPDPCLGITAVGVSAQGPHLTDRLDELARRAHGACLVNELIHSSRTAGAAVAGGPAEQRSKSESKRQGKGEQT